MMTVINYIKNKLENKVSLLFYALLILHLIPLFFGKYFLTQDGPSHLYNAFVFKDILFHSHSLYANYFDINNVPNPNWLITVFYSLLMLIFPAFVVEKIFLVLYVLLLPLSFRYLIKQINPNSDFITLLIFPLVYNITLYLGFFNFCFSIILFFYATGYWLKYQGLFSVKKFLVFVILVTLTYFSHPVSFVILCMMIGVFMIAALMQDIQNRNRAFMRFFKRIFVFLIALLPAIYFFLKFFKQSGTAISFASRDIKTYLADALDGNLLSFPVKNDLAFCAIFVAILILFFAFNLYIRIKDKRPQKLDILYLFLVLFSILTFISPEEIAGGSVILIRLVLYSNIIAIICISAASYPEKVKQYSTYIIFVFALCWLGFKSYHFQKTHENLAEIMSIGKNISTSKTLLPFTIGEANSDSSPLDTIRDIDINVYLHAAMYICAEKRLVCLSNYEASQSYFPLKWKFGRDPSFYFPETGEMLKDSSISSYKAKVGTWPDYILIWDETGHVADRKALIKEMVKNYTLEQIQSNNKVALYRKNTRI